MLSVKNNIKIINIQCGNKYMLVSDTNGKVYAWCCNQFDECALGGIISWEECKLEHPVFLKAIELSKIFSHFFNCLL